MKRPICSTALPRLCTSWLPRSRPPSQPLRRFLVQQLIVAAGDRLRRTLGGAIRLQTCVSGGTPAVRCPPRLLEDILIGLAILARAAMPDGGVLLIESRTRHAHDRPPQRPIVCVTVTGTGRDQAQSGRPERMVCLGSREERDCAWSLGFRAVRRLVEEIGGVAELEQLPGGGSCVRLRLPGCADRA
jgi:signal transduction histidine kinase